MLTPSSPKIRLGLVMTVLVCELVLQAQVVIAGDIEIQISGVEGAAGELRVAVYSSADGFLEPDRFSLGIRTQLKSLADPSQVLIRVNGLQPGRYAVTCYHDEDGDGERDSNLIGIPTEGYGASGESKRVMGPPSFEDAAFEVGSELVRVPIELSY
jgi:uncharacterized protein (DUF2141 family)